MFSLSVYSYHITTSPQGSKKANPLRLTLELIKQAGGIAPHEFSNPAPDQRVWFGLELAYNTADKAAATCIHHGMLAVYSQPYSNWRDPMAKVLKLKVRPIFVPHLDTLS